MNTWYDLLFAIIIILGVVSVPSAAFLVLALIERWSTPVLTGRELVAEGIFSHLVHGDVVSTQGLRVIAYPVTVVHFEDRSPCLVQHTLLTKLPAGTRVRLWRNAANDEHSLEEVKQSE